MLEDHSLFVHGIYKLPTAHNWSPEHCRQTFHGLDLHHGSIPWIYTTLLTSTAGDLYQSYFNVLYDQWDLLSQLDLHHGHLPWIYTTPLLTANVDLHQFDFNFFHNQCNHFGRAHHITHINSGGITDKPTNSLDNPAMTRDDCPGKLIQRNSS